MRAFKKFSDPLWRNFNLSEGINPLDRIFTSNAFISYEDDRRLCEEALRAGDPRAIEIMRKFVIFRLKGST